MNDEEFQIACNLYDDRRFEAAFGKFLNLAEAGDLSSMTWVALMYAAGQGVERDIQRSIEWDQKAAALGSHTAIFNLGATYRDLGDFEAAKRWFEQSLALGDGEAALELAKIYHAREHEPDQVKEYLRCAVSAKDVCEASREEAEAMLEKLET